MQNVKTNLPMCRGFVDGAGLLPSQRIQWTESEAVVHNQRFWKNSHGSGFVE